MTNVSLEHMDSQVAIIDYSLKELSVSSLFLHFCLPTIGLWVELTELPISGRHGFEIRTHLAEDFLSIFDYAIDNAYLLYKHDCRTYGTRPKDIFAFHLLVHQLLEQVGL